MGFLPGSGAHFYGTTIFNEAQIKKLEDAFRAADTNDDAALDKGELQQMWRTVFPGIPPADVREITDEVFQDLDPNGDGEVSFGELKAYLLNQQPASKYTEVDRILQPQCAPGAPVTCREQLWACTELDAPVYKECPRWLRTARSAVMVISPLAILLSVILLIVESLPAYQHADGSVGTGSTFAMECACVGIFTLELICHAIGAPDQCDFWLSWWTFVDLISILPFYVSLALSDESNAGSGAVALRVMRVLRLLRAIKLGKGFICVRLMVIAVGQVMKPIVVLMLFLYSTIALMSGSLMYTAELSQSTWREEIDKWVRDNDSQWADAGSVIGYQTIPDAIWFALVTVTTVGYGDLYPATHWGRVVATFTMVIGPVVLACPLTLISSAYGDACNEFDAKRRLLLRRQAFQQNIEMASAIAEGQPLLLHKPADFSEGQLVRHEWRGLGVITAVIPGRGVSVRFKSGKHPLCSRSHLYKMSQLKRGKLRAAYGCRDFAAGAVVMHQCEGRGVVTKSDPQAVHVRYERDGRAAKYSAAALTDGLLRPADEPASPQRLCGPSPERTRRSARDSSEDSQDISLTGVIADRHVSGVDLDPAAAEPAIQSQRHPSVPLANRLRTRSGPVTEPYGCAAGAAGPAGEPCVPLALLRELLAEHAAHTETRLAELEERINRRLDERFGRLTAMLDAASAMGDPASES
eukprot:TRINITY_DN5484_c3_g1_i1.p1 TRINITY_DN5484_c3_g1~~TRINITY_DN5484_c3_g1_i1.p1  ORF type:complete len:695 (+),score=198.74 TRINITY_DN5484_c3_g1_i1:132-2216(+)